MRTVSAKRRFRSIRRFATIGRPIGLSLAVALTSCSTKAHIKSDTHPPTTPPMVSRTFPFIRDADFNPKPRHTGLTLGDSTVTVSYLPDPDYARTQTRVTYVQRRQILFDRSIGADAPLSVALVATHSTRNPLVVIRTTSGGAHCCIGSVVVDAETEADVHVRRDDWGDGDFQVRRGTPTKDPVLIGYQAAAPYAFGSFAGTAFAVKVVRYKNGELIDAAKTYPEIVGADAQRHLSDYLHEGAGNRPIGRSSLVAYMIDMCRIGKCDQGWQRLRAVYGEPDRDEFLPAVLEALRRYGTAMPNMPTAAP